MSARSTSRYDGPRTGFRDDEPMVKTGAAVKAAVLNHRLGVRWSAGSVGSSTRFGLCTPKPKAALLFVVCVIATGIPDCSVMRVVTVQLLANAPSTPLNCRRRPVPAGRSHTTDDTNTWGMSPVE